MVLRLRLRLRLRLPLRALLTLRLWRLSGLRLRLSLRLRRLLRLLLSPGLALHRRTPQPDANTIERRLHPFSMWAAPLTQPSRAPK